MKFPRLLHRRLAVLDARVADAKARARDATREAEKSRARREKIREDVVEPLSEAADYNHFAELIRRTLIQGHGNHV